jgi:hypothetical protein
MDKRPAPPVVGGSRAAPAPGGWHPARAATGGAGDSTSTTTCAPPATSSRSGTRKPSTGRPCRATCWRISSREPRPGRRWCRHRSSRRSRRSGCSGPGAGGRNGARDAATGAGGGRALTEGGALGWHATTDCGACGSAGLSRQPRRTHAPWASSNARAYASRGWFEGGIPSSKEGNGGSLRVIPGFRVNEDRRLPSGAVGFP